jgi:hypothetical protein
MNTEAPATPQTKIPIVLGILSLIFGSIQAVYGLISTVMTWLFTGVASSLTNTLRHAVGGEAEAKRIFDLVQQAIDVTRPYTLILNLSSLAVAGGLIFVGWGLYNRTWWARQATIAWCAGAFIVIIMRVAINQIMTAKIMGIVGQLIDTPALKAQLQAESLPMGDGRWSLIFGSVVLAIYPTILAALIARPSAQAEFPPKPTT